MRPIVHDIDGVETARAARQMTIAQCRDGCPCQRVHVVLLDGEGEAFATASLSLETAVTLSHDLARAIEHAAHRQGVAGRA